MKKMRLLTLLPVPLAVWSLACPAITAQVQLLGTRGGILRPSGDATLTNIVLASGVSPEGNRHFSKDVFLIQPATGSVKQLTGFADTIDTPGATSVAIAPEGTSAAYLALYNKGGQQAEEVHVLDLPGGNDRLIATNTEPCIQPSCANCVLPCLHDLHYSADGKQILWASSHGNPFFVAKVNGSGVLRLSVPDGILANSANVVTADGRLVFLRYTNGQAGPWAAALDGSSLTPLGYGPVNSDFVVSSDASTFAWQQQDAIAVVRNNQLSTVVSSGPFSSLALSASGNKLSFLAGGQIWAPARITAYQFSEVRDVAWNAAGTKLLFSTAETGNAQTAAVWIANADGSNLQAVYAPGSINPNGVIGINSQGLPLALSPGSYFTIYGQNLHPKDELLTSSVPVTVSGPGGVYPVQALTPWQINTFLPMSVPPVPVTLTVNLESGRQLTYTANVAATAPAIVTYPDATGKQQAAAFHLSTLLPCDAQHPARAGETVETYGFGLGATDIPQITGVPAPFQPLVKTLIAPAVLVGTQKAQILFSGLVPGLIGVYQINIITPAVSQGDYQIQWTTGDVTPVSSGNFSVR